MTASPSVWSQPNSDPNRPFALASLANPMLHRAAPSVPKIDATTFAGALERMILIRVVEEKIADMVVAGHIKCPCHLAIGQEACAVGVAMHLRPSDRVFGAHRSHGHYLALGGSVHGLLAEVLGKDTGVSRGMGGSMHLISPAHGLLGTVPIVGATIPIATGAGLAAKMDKRGDVAVSFFGDGATEEGVFHESMNLAAVMSLPVLFVCENNLFSSHLHISLRQPEDSVARYAEAHGMRWARVDGNDIAAVSSVAADAVAAMRRGAGPHFLELVTYRWRGHVGPRDDEDVGVQRKDNLPAWRERDPISRLATALIEIDALDRKELDALWTAARLDTDAQWQRAVEDPYPSPAALLDRVYAPVSARKS